MENPPSNRRRAVRLNQDALVLLQNALEEALGKSDGERKLTWANRAELLDVSIVTAHRILSREGVDRATLRIAFNHIGLEWQDSYCEFIVPQPERKSREKVGPSNSPTMVSSEPVWKTRFSAYAAVVVILAVSIALQVRLTDSPGPAWGAIFAPTMEEATKQYNEGHYPEASRLVGQAIDLARAHQAASHLASALRLSGDIAAATGSYELARNRYQEALVFRRTLKQTSMLAPILEAQATVEIRMGMLAEASVHLEECLSKFRAERNPVGVAMACRTLGMLHIQRGDSKQAATWIRAGLSELKGLHQPELVADLGAELALVKRDQGNLNEARRELQACLSYWITRAHRRWIARTQLQLATVEAKALNFRECDSLLRQSQGSFRAVGDMGSLSECTALRKQLSEVTSVMVSEQN